MPGLDRTWVVGLVTLPDALVGMPLGGTPLRPGAVRMFVLVALTLVQVAAVSVVLELSARGLLHRVQSCESEGSEGPAGT